VSGDRARLHAAYLEAMGIQAWRLRGAASPAASRESNATPAAPPAQPRLSVETRPPETGGCSVSAPTHSVAVVSGQASRQSVAAFDWPQLEAAVAGCTLCELHEGRTHTVFGVGNRGARWLIIGEAPGRDEDLQGEPFVGRAGQLLNAMLLAIGLQREQVYIANILKCRPPNNRDPRPEEVVCCEPYLLRQIALIRPRLILAVGRIAAQNLLKTDQAIGKLRGRVHYLGETRIPVIATYHPAYLLRSPQEKRKAWQDLQLAQQVFAENAG